MIITIRKHQNRKRNKDIIAISKENPYLALARMNVTGEWISFKSANELVGLELAPTPLIQKAIILLNKINFAPIVNALDGSFKAFEYNSKLNLVTCVPI